MTFPLFPRHRFVVFLSLLAGLNGAVRAAELGEPVVRSHIGQPLVADIELNTLNDADTPVTVRMAHADVYKGAGIAMNPALQSVTMSVMKRDGRQFLHMTSLRAVSSENVHLFLELIDGGKRNLRAVTLWLTPDPTPAPPPAPLPAPAPAPAPVAAAAAPAPLPRPARVLTLPARPVAAAVCPQPQFSADQIQACAVINEKNAQLTAQIVDLEAKVKLLQLAIEGKTAAPAAHAPAVAPPLRPKKKVQDEAAEHAQPDHGGFPWLLMIGILTALALLGGGGAWFWLRRARQQPAAEPAAAPAEAKSAWRQRLLARFKRAPKGAAAAAATEAPAA